MRSLSFYTASITWLKYRSQLGISAENGSDFCENCTKILADKNTYKPVKINGLERIHQGGNVLFCDTTTLRLL